MMISAHPAAPEFVAPPAHEIVAAVRANPTIRAAVLAMVGEDANKPALYLSVVDALPAGCPFRARDVIAACLDRTAGPCRLAVSI